MPLTDWAISILPRAALAALISLSAWAGTPNPAPPTRLKVVLDPGHGGEDVGAKGRTGLLEKDVALDLAKALKGVLEAAGFQALLTRGEDAFLPLRDRARLANEAGADLFLSLHLNAARARGARGSEVYFLSLDQGDADAEEVANLENAGERAAEPGADPVLSSILQDLAQKAYLQESERLAVAIQRQLNRLGGIKERGVKQAPFAVLRGAAMPAALVELSFISNPKEEARLRDAAFTLKAAESIAQGIRQFFASITATPRRKTAEALGDAPNFSPAPSGR